MSDIRDATSYRRMNAAQYAAWLAKGGNLSQAATASRSLASQSVATLNLEDPAGKSPTSLDMGPGSPLTPMHQDTVEPRRMDYQPGRNVVARPRQYLPLTPDTIRQICRTYDVARIAIQARKDEVRGWDRDVVVQPLRGLTREQQKARSASFAPDVARIAGFLESPDQEHDFGTWLSMYLEEQLVLDAPAIYLRPTLGGDLYAAEIIAGDTIVPLIDAFGRIPKLATTARPSPHIHDWQQAGDGSICAVCHWPSAYQQIIHGSVWATFAYYEMLYTPYNVGADTYPYGTPPILWVQMAVNRALRRQSMDLANFTDGTLPASIYRLPEGWTSTQSQALQDYWDLLQAGDDRARSKVRFLPGGTGSGLDRLNPEPTNDVEKWLMHVTAAAFGTSAYELGFEPDSGLGGAGFGDNSRSSAERRGAKPLSSNLAAVINRIIARLNAPTLRHVWRGLGETADRLKEAQRREIEWKAGTYGTDEWREDTGRDPIGLGPTLFDPKIGVVLVTDVIALSAATAGAEAALVTATLDPTGQAPQAAEAAGAAAAIGDVPSARPDETTIGSKVGTPAVGGTPLGQASVAGELGAWERKAVRAVKVGRDGTRFVSDVLPQQLVDQVADGLRQVSTVAEVRAVFAALREGSPA